MPVFSYTAKDLKGEYHRGEVETVDQYHAANLLRRKKLILISLKPKLETERHFWEKIYSRVSFAEVVMMTRQLATMVQAGLILSEAVDILEEQQDKGKLKKVLREISADVKSGMDFAGALDKHPDVFPPLYSKLVRAGQTSGKLDTILLDLATNLEKEQAFKSKVRGAMIYPAIVISMMGGVGMIMVFFVMPKLMGMYKESGLELPLPTKIMLGLSTLMISYWWAVILLIVFTVINFRRFIKTPQGRSILDQFILKAPVLGKVTEQVILTNFTRTFGLLIASGIPILESIKVVGDITDNKVYRDNLEIAYKGVERGLSFSSQLLGLNIFPRIVGQMIRVGEETGKLDEIMLKLADYFEAESDNSLKNITTLIEPLILIILGLGVAVLVISVIMPIYQLTTNIK